MKKFDNILIASDLDGTLLKNDKSVSEKNKAAIEYFCNEGGKFTFITGRSPKGALPVLEQIMPNIPIGCLNGCGIYDAIKQKYLFKKSIDASIVELVEYIDKTFPKIGIELVGFDNIYFAKKSQSTETHRKDEKLEDLICDYHFPKETTAKILLAARADELKPMIESLKYQPHYNDFSFILSDKEYFEILPKGASKGNLLKEISSFLNTPISKTIAVGDNDNDISMIMAAGIGIAVENASFGVKNACNITTVSNENDAIAKIIEDLDNKKIRL